MSLQIHLYRAWKVENLRVKGLSEKVSPFVCIYYLRAYSKRILSPLLSSAKITGDAPVDPRSSDGTI